MDMDLFKAMQERRSCRDYLPEPVSEEVIEKILEAATWAPSPLNTQPWEFFVITSKEAKGKIFDEANRCRMWALERSGWKWLDSYQIDFLQQAPVIIAIVGDPKKTGVDMFMEDGNVAYQAACAAAIQNMHLAAHSLGLGSLWFTLFDKKVVKEILGIDQAKNPVALICLGKCVSEPQKVPRKNVKDKTTYIR
ncbi:MAG: nitroreductase [Syntrophus sp. (in: bacteria)]|nr:nitroreductase [Syntrophus sp. (in: bacteria)]